MLIVKSIKVESCPYCHLSKVVKNGVKSTGMQNYRFKNCGKQFQAEYLYWGSDKSVKDKILPMLLRGSGVRDCACVLGISTGVVLRHLILEAESIVIRPVRRRYHKVQIDEQWSYVKKKQRKVWLLYAYCYESGEILAFSMGKRSARTVRHLMLKLKGLEIDFYLTDEWEAFRCMLPYFQHIIGKKYTKAIEGMNTWFRTRLRRLVRRTVCFSKKLLNHFSMIKLAIFHRNKQPSYI